MCPRSGKRRRPRQPGRDRAAARLNYLAADRPDLAGAAKDVARRMAGPGQQDLEKIKGVAKHMLSREFGRIVQQFQCVAKPPKVVVYSDFDWAGCRETRQRATASSELSAGPASIGPACSGRLPVARRRPNHTPSICPPPISGSSVVSSSPRRPPRAGLGGGAESDNSSTSRCKSPGSIALHRAAGRSSGGVLHQAPGWSRQARLHAQGSQH